MRTVELAKVAVSAEALRLRRVARRQAFRAGFAMGAAIFALAILVVLHVVLFIIMRWWLSPILAILVVLAVDVIVAAILGMLAMRNTPDAVEQEAYQIRAQALIELKRSLTFMGTAAEVAGLVIRGQARTGVRRSVANMAAEMASRLIGR